MCVILHNPNNLPFIKDELRQHYIKNSDGTGVYYYNQRLDKVTVKKFKKGTDFEEIGRTVGNLYRYRQIRNVNIHFRYGTSGGVGLPQTHPIAMSNGIHMMHNGVMPVFEYDKTILSDTQCAAFGLDNLFEKSGVEHVKQIDMKSLDMLKHIFEYNKVLLLQKDYCVIINEQLGEGKNGIGRSYKDYSQVKYIEYRV